VLRNAHKRRCVIWSYDEDADVTCDAYVNVHLSRYGYRTWAGGWWAIDCYDGDEYDAVDYDDHPYDPSDPYGTGDYGPYGDL
jgi:hypothetical protein